MNATPMRFLLFFLVVLSGCQQKTPTESRAEVDSTSTAVALQDSYETPETRYDYKELFGVYDHEGTTKEFSAVLALRQNGNDLYFHVSVAGSCEGETEGVVLMLDQNQNYYSGFYESENCRLQFTFILREKTVDIKEVSLCKVLESGCSFAGTYLKRSI